MTAYRCLQTGKLAVLANTGHLITPAAVETTIEFFECGSGAEADQRHSKDHSWSLTDVSGQMLVRPGAPRASQWWRVERLNRAVGVNEVNRERGE
jgi:hypothetical protein